jgi:hypothetical protein
MNNLHPIAQAVQSQGRGKDTQLVHMTPGEVAGMQALAKAHGGSLSINPSTGLPEAGFLESLLPTILGAGLAAATGGSSLMIGGGLGALQYARTGSLEKGLMAGLGAYGGAGLGAGLAGAGATAGSQTMTNLAAEQASQLGKAKLAEDVATKELAQAAAKKAGENLALQQANALGANTFSQNLSNMGTGLKTAFSSPTTFMEQFGGAGKDLAMSAGAAAAPTLLQQPRTVTPPADNEQFRYSYDPGRVSEEELARQREENPYGELKYFRPTYGPRQTVQVAQGGILGYADGGTSDYEYDPVTQTYKNQASAPVGAVPSIGVPGSGGSSGGDSIIATQPLSKQTIDFLDKEDKSPGGARDQRMGKINDILAMLAPGAMAAKAFQTVIGATPTDTRMPVETRNANSPVSVQTRSVNQDSSRDSGPTVTADPTGATETYGDTSMGTLFAQGGALRYEDGGPIGAVEPVGLRGNRPMDAGYFKDMAADAARNAVISKLGQAVGLSPQVMALGMAGKGIYNFFNPDNPGAPVKTGSDYPSVPGQNPSGDSGSYQDYSNMSQQELAESGGGVGAAKGGLMGLAAGGMSKGGFVVPADVVSALGNGSTDAGLRALNKKLAATPIKGKGDGLSDSIPTSIDGKQPARVADGEAYISPQTVAKIGGGDAKKGAKKLYAMMDRVRQQAHGKKSQQRRVNPNTAV